MIYQRRILLNPIPYPTGARGVDIEGYLAPKLDKPQPIKMRCGFCGQNSFDAITHMAQKCNYCGATLNLLNMPTKNWDYEI